ncbi:hypothetical protein CHI08_20525 [Peribacillus simplex]|nr:hypothetical protein CHI08_20525 [Peribacillus simplex]
MLRQPFSYALKGQDTSSYIFSAIYWVGIIIWSLKNKEKAKKDLLQIKNIWKTGVIVFLLVFSPFFVVALIIFIQ